MDLESWGQLGDTVGGLSNFVTMVVAVAAATYARREVQRAREQHSNELRAAKAFELWQRTLPFFDVTTRALEAPTRGFHVPRELTAEMRACSSEVDFLFGDDVQVAYAEAEAAAQAAWTALRVAQTQSSAGDLIVDETKLGPVDDLLRVHLAKSAALKDALRRYAVWDDVDRIRPLRGAGSRELLGARAD